MTYNKGRQGRPWWRLRRQVLREEPNCWLCGAPIDFHAEPRSRWAPSVDHVVPLSPPWNGPPLDRTNLRAAHYGCNSARHDDPGFEIQRHSRIW
jgi:5-methylcytosine-specific restriction endonuclease McrA